MSTAWGSSDRTGCNHTSCSPVYDGAAGDVRCSARENSEGAFRLAVFALRCHRLRVGAVSFGGHGERGAGNHGRRAGSRTRADQVAAAGRSGPLGEPVRPCGAGATLAGRRVLVLKVSSGVEAGKIGVIVGDDFGPTPGGLAVLTRRAALRPATGAPSRTRSRSSLFVAVPPALP